MSIGAISWRWRFLMMALALVVVMGLVVEMALLRNQHVSTRETTSNTIAESGATISIPQGQDQFDPFILAVQPNTLVTWKNDDSATRVFSTTPQSSAFLNPQSFAFRVIPGEQVAFRFSIPGIYHYYETGMDTWNATFSRVVALKGLRRYPLSMEGIIWVQGPLHKLPQSTINFVVQGHDMFASEFIAIATNGAVTWHNLDEDPHFVGLVAGWSSPSSPINPVDIGLYRIAGTDEIPGGDSITVLFTHPGLYYYYCRNHDRVDPQTHRAKPLMMASEYPIPMEGFVLVA